METLVHLSNSTSSELPMKLPWSMSSMWSPNPEQQWWTFWRLYYPELVWPTFYNSEAVTSHWNIPPRSPVVSTIGANSTTTRSNLKFGIDVILSDLSDAKRTVQDSYYTHGQDHELATDLSAKSQTPSSLASTTTSSTPSRRKRSWSRAVFSNLQRKGLEKRFQLQKYITKPDRRQLAATLGLTDAQVKVWFQNRRMKWRHNRDKSHQVANSSTPTPSSAQQ